MSNDSFLDNEDLEVLSRLGVVDLYDPLFSLAKSLWKQNVHHSSIGWIFGYYMDMGESVREDLIKKLDAGLVQKSETTLGQVAALYAKPAALLSYYAESTKASV